VSGGRDWHQSTTGSMRVAGQ